jgi:hypothetical protein
MEWRLIAAGGVLSLVSGGTLAVQHVHTAQHQAQAEQHQAQQDHDYTVRQLLPTSPASALITQHVMISRHDDTTACLLMSPDARTQFAAAYGAPDCQPAMRQLAAAVTNPARYQVPHVPDQAIVAGTTVATASGCAVTWTLPSDTTPLPDPGPRLGTLTLTRQGTGGYLITSYKPC